MVGWSEPSAATTSELLLKMSLALEDSLISVALTLVNLRSKHEKHAGDRSDGSQKCTVGCEESRDSLERAVVGASLSDLFS